MLDFKGDYLTAGDNVVFILSGREKIRLLYGEILEITSEYAKIETSKEKGYNNEYERCEYGGKVYRIFESNQISKL